MASYGKRMGENVSFCNAMLDQTNFADAVSAKKCVKYVKWVVEACSVI